MAIGDYKYCDVDSLILPSKLYFPLTIQVTHFQLRHYISSTEPNIIYYADRESVYSLNVKNSRRRLLATLPFEAQCTASGHGYICVGGNVDAAVNFAVIKLHSTAEYGAAEVDEQLPLHLGARLPEQDNKAASKTSVHFETMGTQIVNSISIHKLSVDNHDEVVAVSTNNDQTVRIFSLTQNQELACLDHPFEMNHASISPDGSRLVAVGDAQRAFFYERAVSESQDTVDTIVDNDTNMGWSLMMIVDLHCPSSREEIGYFTSAWSSLSNLCAVGSECGYVTVFDVSVLKATANADKATIRIVKSSRPELGYGPGSVRTLLFAPYPWDLLIWGEDQGRICVADLRAGLLARQVLDLDTDCDSLKREIIDEVLDETAFEVYPEQDIAQDLDALRRYRRGMASGGSAPPLSYGYSEVAATRSRMIRAGVVESDNDPNGLTPDERRVMEAIRPSSPPEAEGHYRSLRAINHALGRQSSRPDQASEAGLLRSFLPTMGSYGHLLGDQAPENERRRFEPRRQASIVIDRHALSADHSTAPRSVPAAYYDPQTDPNSVLATNQRSSTQMNPTPAQLRALQQITERRMRADLRQRSTVQPSPEQAMNELRRLRALHPQRYDVAIQRRQTTPRFDASQGSRTAGLAMSHDGRQLYVGAENGIHVYNINTTARKMCAAVVPR